MFFGVRFREFHCSIISNTMFWMIVIVFVFVMDYGVSTLSLVGNDTGIAIGKPCVDVGVFQTWYGDSVLQCKEACMRRSRCAGFIYYQPMAQCTLSETLTQDDVTGGPSAETNICVFGIKSAWVTGSMVTGSMGPCDSSPCLIREQCVSDITGSPGDSDSYSCVPSDCGEPPVIANAGLRHDVTAVGSINAFVCNNGFYKYGDASLECMSSGYWSSIRGCCGNISCGQPMELDSAMVDYQSDTRRLPGSKVEYTCKDGYYSLHRLGVTSTCDCDAQWMNNIKCCKDGYTAIGTPVEFCLKYFPVETAGSLSEMTAVCINNTDNGMHVDVTHSQMQSEIMDLLSNENITSDILLNTKLSLNFEAYHNSSLCVINHTFVIDGVDLTNATGMSLYHTAIANDWNDCNVDILTAEPYTNWAPGQPKWGSGKDCVAIVPTAGYQWRSVHCENIGNIYGFVCEQRYRKPDFLHRG